VLGDRRLAAVHGDGIDVESAAGELGCVAMEVTSARSRAGSHPFYQNLGYQDQGERSARYVKDLAADAAVTSDSAGFPVPPLDLPHYHGVGVVVPTGGSRPGEGDTPAGTVKEVTGA